MVWNTVSLIIESCHRKFRGGWFGYWVMRWWTTTWEAARQKHNVVLVTYPVVYRRRCVLLKPVSVRGVNIDWCQRILNTSKPTLTSLLPLSVCRLSPITWLVDDVIWRREPRRSSPVLLQNPGTASTYISTPLYTIIPTCQVWLDPYSGTTEQVRQTINTAGQHVTIIWLQ